MQLVLAYTGGDGFTYSCAVRLPIEHESPEAARVEFDERAQQHYVNGRTDFAARRFEFCGRIIDATDFFEDGKYYAPEFWTIDEWFAHDV